MEIQAVRVLLEQHHRESYGWALMCCGGSPLQAEEVLQNAYLKILEGRAMFGGRATFKTWLFSVIRKTAADEHRRSRLRRLLFADFAEDDPGQWGENLDEGMERSELQRMFQQALRALPRRQQEILQLVFYHDLTLEGAADVMKISLGSVRTHYDRGKKRLRHIMEESHVIDTSRTGRKENPRIVPATKVGR